MRPSLIALVGTLIVLAACQQRESTVDDQAGETANERVVDASEDAAEPAADVEGTAARTEATDQEAGGAAAGSDEELIEQAEEAAPDPVAAEATVIVVDAQGQMRTLREGTGNFTCMPDNPNSPGRDPMCLDKAGVAWAQAWMSREDPPAGEVGFGYMLAGGSDASNEDPFATTPAPGEDWIDTGPHVMVLNPPKAMLEGYPLQAGDPSKPFVMFPGTPYEHLMIPVR